MEGSIQNSKKTERGFGGQMYRVCVFPAAISVFFVLLFPLHSQAQIAPGGAPGGFYSNSKLEPIDNSSLAVQVRAPNGSTLDTLAVVTLCNLSGQTITSKTTFGSQAVFTPLNKGQYTINVEAAGYTKAQAEAQIISSHGQQLVIVTLQPDSGAGITYTAPVGVVLSPKAQKESGKGVEALQANKFDEAVKHLEAAHHLAPNHPDVSYMLGMVYEKKGDFVTARKCWDEALRAYPKHLSSLLASGDVALRQDDIAGGRKYLDQAVDVAPNSWRAHSLLANALLRQHSYAEAVTHAERAMELGKGQANSSLLILGQALAAERQNDQAIAALKDYLASKPPEQQAQAVEKLIVRLKDSPGGPAGATVGGVTTSYENAPVANDVPELPLTAAALHWLPANVDDAVPSVEPGVSCALDDVVKNASSHVTDLPALVDRYTATEILHHEEVNAAGYADHVENLSFNYLASIREIKNKFGEFLDVQEYRNGSTGNDMFPDQMASTGLPSVVLIFHPWLISDFEMHCEGLSRVRTGFAWQIYFTQKKDKESRIRQYRMGGHVYPIALKGRAWIDANTFQVVRLETDLREVRQDLRLNAEHLVMEYGPVHFKSRKEVLWLPASADYYAIFRGHRFRRRHSFSDYILFSIDDKQKLGEPSKEKTSADSAVDKKSSN
jgi:tetratricopeptide (TPR) repeat protein